MPALPTIIEITEADTLQEIIYIVQPSKRVSLQMLKIYAVNNPRSCRWLNNNTLAMSWAAFSLFVLGPAEGFLMPLEGKFVIPQDDALWQDIKDELVGVDAVYLYECAMNKRKVNGRDENRS